jgi:fructose-bisphosphate aldolase class I
MDREALEATARALAAPGKGILAADESTPTMGKRLAQLGLPNEPGLRREFRETLFTALGMEQHISGVILFDETLRQVASDGRGMAALLESKGVIPGIKVDGGAHPMDDAPGEKLTAGLDGLAERCAEYYEHGARFDKWRAVITIGDGLPTSPSVQGNVDALADYARISQDAGLVPIVEPEVLMDGTHPISRCYEITECTLNRVFGALADRGVHLPGILLKPNMVISASDAPDRAGVDEVARETLRCLKATVPAEVPGIMFLSGGQSEVEATAHLNAMNAQGGGPWELSFSYGRALQQSALQVWGGDASNCAAAQAAFVQRARLNGAARYGRYVAEMEA